MSKAGECVLCGQHRQSLHRDHVKPKWEGGNDDESNVQYVCANCHEDKSRSEAHRWRSMNLGNHGGGWLDRGQRRINLISEQNETIAAMTRIHDLYDNPDDHNTHDCEVRGCDEHEVTA